MSTLPDNFYAHWRARHAPGLLLREDHDSLPSEQFLQSVWQQQRLLRDQLVTLDGRTVRVLHPGFKNHESGPDFSGAMVRIEGAPVISGDLEVDLQPGGWRAHGHDRNPAFRNVILQVIWDGDRPVAENIPVVALKGKLDAPLAELVLSLGRDSLHSLPENLRGQCSGPLRDLPPASLAKLLHAAAEVRWQGKAA